MLRASFCFFRDGYSSLAGFGWPVCLRALAPGPWGLRGRLEVLGVGVPPGRIESPSGGGGEPRESLKREGPNLLADLIGRTTVTALP